MSILRVSTVDFNWSPNNRIRPIIYQFDPTDWLEMTRYRSSYRQVFVTRRGRMLHKLVFDTGTRYFTYLINNRIIDQGSYL